MKNPLYLTLLSTLAGVLALHCTTSGSPQEVLQYTQADEADLPGFTRVQSGPFSGRRALGTRKSDTQQLRELMKQYKDADGEDQDELENKIRSTLEEQYDEFLAQNEKQIEQLQERLNKLKDQLDRRRRAKSKMVDLEFERMANEAEGLIWPDRQFGGATLWRTGPTGLGVNPGPLPDAAPVMPQLARPPGAAR